MPTCLENCESLPPEILLNIFSFLPARELIKCRRVSRMWKELVDDHAKGEALWLKYCQEDYPILYKEACSKSRPDISRYNMYKCLALWPKLALAQESIHEFAVAVSNSDEENHYFEVFDGGKVGILRKSSITYYDIITYNEVNKEPVLGEYVRCSSNGEFMVTLSYFYHLHITKKSEFAAGMLANATFDDVKMFILLETKVYYLTLEEEIFMCDLLDPALSRTFIVKADDELISLGIRNDVLHVLTFERNIYALRNNRLELVALERESNLVQQLRDYKFVVQLDTRIYFQLMVLFRQNIPDGPLRETATIKWYGDMLFIGSTWGSVLIYHVPKTTSVFDIQASEPIKKYNFSETILMIDVAEMENGHNIFVGMPNKMVVLSFVHRMPN